MKKRANFNSIKKLIFIVVILSICTYLLMLFLSDYKLKNLSFDKEFICPEYQTTEQAEIDTEEFSKFYFENYPDMTFNDFLTIRINLLLEHRCMVSLGNIANNVGVEVIDIEKHKNTLYKSGNITLKEMQGTLYRYK